MNPIESLKEQKEKQDIIADYEGIIHILKLEKFKYKKEFSLKYLEQLRYLENKAIKISFDFFDKLEEFKIKELGL